jgi:hypothetical protein
MMARKIESLTARQEARFTEFVAAWTQVGLSTAPADRPGAEVAIAGMYRCAGVAPPGKIVWCGSPLSLALSRAAILDKRPLGTIGTAVPDGIAKSVWESTEASVSDTGDAAAGYCFSDHLGHKVLMSVQDDVRASISEQVWSHVRTSISDAVWDNISDAVSVWDGVRAAWARCASAVLSEAVSQCIDGQHDAGLLATYRYFHQVLDLKPQTEKLSGYWQLAQSANMVLPHQNICWVCERRDTLKLDGEGFLHSVAGAACAYPDGFAIHAIHGVQVPAFVIERPRDITVKKIDDEINAEVRRVMIDRYRDGEEINGAAAFLRDAGGVRVDHDEKFGTLWRREISDDEPIVLLEVINATPEPDGRFKHYWLRVPPTMTTAHEAAAWTFDRSPEDYAPQVES